MGKAKESKPLGTRLNPETGERERPTVCPRCKSPRWDKPKRDG